MTDPSALRSGDATAGDGFEAFSRQRWSALGRRPGAPPPLAAQVAEAVAGLPIPLDEVVDIYLPLCQLLTVLMEAGRARAEGLDLTLGRQGLDRPFIIGITGSVAVGKSTTARVLQALLGSGGSRPAVDLLTTDAFLHPNRVLEERRLTERKGFPESYDRHGLLSALAAVRAGADRVAVPVYSHREYDILPGEQQVLRRPQILIVEGVNVLQPLVDPAAPDQLVPSDFLDTSLYVDAAEADIFRWFLQRLLALREVGSPDPTPFVGWFSSLTEDEARAVAVETWTGINLVNLRENIAPTRARAAIILEKDGDQQVNRVMLRRP
jgi:type I pantothenate kinase